MADSLCADKLSNAVNEFPLLAFLIELPTFAVLAWLLARGRSVGYWLPSVLGAFLLAFATTLLSYGVADRQFGLLWPQILAALNGYVVFLAAMAIAWLLPRIAERIAPGPGR